MCDLLTILSLTHLDVLNPHKMLIHSLPTPLPLLGQQKMQQSSKDIACGYEGDPCVSPAAPPWQKSNSYLPPTVKNAASPWSPHSECAQVLFPFNKEPALSFCTDSIFSIKRKVNQDKMCTLEKSKLKLILTTNILFH